MPKIKIGQNNEFCWLLKEVYTIDGPVKNINIVQTRYLIPLNKRGLSSFFIIIKNNWILNAKIMLIN